MLLEERVYDELLAPPQGDAAFARPSSGLCQSLTVGGTAMSHTSSSGIEGPHFEALRQANAASAPVAAHRLHSP